MSKETFPPSTLLDSFLVTHTVVKTLSYCLKRLSNSGLIKRVFFGVPFSEICAKKNMSSKRKDSHPARASSTGSASLGINSTVITKVVKVKSVNSCLNLSGSFIKYVVKALLFFTAYLPHLVTIVFEYLRVAIKVKIPPFNCH